MSIMAEVKAGDVFVDLLDPKTDTHPYGVAHVTIPCDRNHVHTQHGKGNKDGEMRTLCWDKGHPIRFVARTRENR